MEILLPIDVAKPELWFSNSNVMYYSTALECIEHIRENKIIKKFIVVIDDQSNEQMILPILKNSNRIHAFFIVNGQNESYLTRVRRFNDIKSLFDHVDTILDDQQSQKLSFHFLSDDQRSILDLSTETPDFMWNQIVLVALQQLPLEARSFDTMINACIDFSQQDTVELQHIEKFRQTYQADKAVEWYTRSSFIFKLVNRALRTRNIDGLLTFAPFICDLHNQIANEQSKQCQIKHTRVVYRGQVLPIAELEQLRNSIGKLVSTNSFFSTTYEQDVAKLFTGYTTSKQFVHAFFIIRVESSLKSTICADISHLSIMKDEKEVLFSLSAVFRVDEVRLIEGSDLWEIKLSASDEGRETFEEYKKLIFRNAETDDPYILFGQVLFQMGLYEKAHQYYTSWKQYVIPVDRFTTAMRNIYHARVLFLWGKYSEALEILLEAQLIFEELGHVSESIQYLKCRFNVANVYVYTGKYTDALEIYQQTLITQRQLLPINDRHIADTLSGISWALSKLGQIEQALYYAMESLKIRRYCLPPYHTTIIHTMKAIGQYHENEGRWQEAEKYYFDAHEITIKYVSKTQTSYAFSLLHLGSFWENQGEYDKALEHFSQALNIYQQAFKQGNPSVAHTLDCIGNIYRRKRNFMDAYDYYHQALKMRHRILPMDHVSFPLTYFGLAKVFLDVRDNDNAIEFFNKTLQLQKKYLDLKHPTICQTSSYLATAYSHDGQLTLARDIFEEALSIQRASNPRGHRDIGITMHHMASNYHRMNRIDQAIVFYRNSIEINQQFYPAGHIEIKSVEKKLQYLLSNHVHNQHFNILHCLLFYIRIFIIFLILFWLLPRPSAFTCI